MNLEAAPELLSILNSVSVVGIVVFILRIVVKGTWLPRVSHDQIVALVQERLEETQVDRDFWRGHALRVTNVAEKAAEMADVAVTRNGHGDGAHA